MGKNFYERRIHESVDDKNLSKIDGKHNSAGKGLSVSFYESIPLWIDQLFMIDTFQTQI